jgi:chromosome partitioning protein
MSLRLDVLNNKGGVGKSTITLVLAEAAARMGKQALVVDMDPQANATRRLGVRSTKTLTTCLQMGVQQGEASNYIHGHRWAGFEHLAIDVLPANLDLEDRALEAGQPGAHYRLRRALFGVDDRYDLTIIDCPPTLKGHLTTLSLAALDGPGDVVLVPLEPEYDAVASARRTVDYVQQWRDDLGVPNARVAGVIVNRVRGTNLHGIREAQFVDTLPDALLRVPLRARIAELQDAGRPLSSDPSMKDILEQFEGLVKMLLKEEKA